MTQLRKFDLGNNVYFIIVRVKCIVTSFVTQEIDHALFTCLSEQDLALDSDFDKKKYANLSNIFL